MCKNSRKDEISVQCQLHQISTSIFFVGPYFQPLGDNFVGMGKVLARPPKLIKKSAFRCLSNLKEKWLEKLAKGLIIRTMTIHDYFVKGGGRPNLKSCMSSKKS